MRSPAEIAFRLSQEATNFWLYLQPPEPSLITPWPLALPPNPGIGRPALASDIECGRYELLGLRGDGETPPRWRRDFVSGRESSTKYFRRIPYLDPTMVGDHKVVWEANRHQQLVVLAMEGRQETLERWLASWMEENPVQRGINWTSALEVGFRALSWIWIWHYAGELFPSRLREKFLRTLWLHGRHLEANLSIYFSPNTHLLGEAVALHALGTLFPHWPSAGRWKRVGRQTVLDCLERQARPDGSHFEQSSFYHVYALDFFLLHHILENGGPAYEAKLRGMALYLDALMGPARSLPYLGDDDGGRVFDSFGPRRHFGRATLALAGQFFPDLALGFEKEDLFPLALCWLGRERCNTPPGPRGPAPARLFPDSGLVAIEWGQKQLLFHGRAWGSGSAGHSHSDGLHFVARHGENEVFRDPGTGTYLGDSAKREWFRGSAAHNTIRVNHRDQAVPGGPFRWRDFAEFEAPRLDATPHGWRAEGAWRGAGVKHRRVLDWDTNAERLRVLDVVDSDKGSAFVEMYWHTEAEPRRWPEGMRVRRVQAWRSEAHGAWEECAAWCADGEVRTPWQWETEWCY